MAEAVRRPRRVSLTAVALAVVAAGSALSGIGMTMASNCCGSPDPADPAPLMIGVAVAVVYALAAAALWQGSGSRRTVGAMTAAAPVACLLAAPFSMDFAALFVPALLGWLAVCALLRSERCAAWFARPRPDRSG